MFWSFLSELYFYLHKHLYKSQKKLTLALFLNNRDIYKKISQSHEISDFLNFYILLSWHKIKFAKSVKFGVVNTTRMWGFEKKSNISLQTTTLTQILSRLIPACRTLARRQRAELEGINHACLGLWRRD